MMKIKIEKEVNLPELIQWAWDNPKLSGNKDSIQTMLNATVV